MKRIFLLIGTCLLLLAVGATALHLRDLSKAKAWRAETATAEFRRCESELPPRVRQAFQSKLNLESLAAEGAFNNLLRAVAPCLEQDAFCSRQGWSLGWVEAKRMAPKARGLRLAFLATALERHFSQRELLCLHLAYLPFGRRGTGVYAAARAYFGKELPDLSLGEVASLAAISMAPDLLDPDANPEAYGWQHDILRKMEEFGFITPEEVKNAMLRGR